jgi:decaprenylphospho-beta-D-erythro-pentofuranosid-2-ulose 2-reductase
MKDALGEVQSVLLFGGTSDIGLAIARRLAAPRRAAVILAGRDHEALEAAARQLQLGETPAGDVRTVAFDALDTEGHDQVLDDAAAMVGDLDVVIVAFGVLGDQAADEAGGSGAVHLAAANYVGTVSVGLAAARRLRTQGHGVLIVLSSVAGERVRKANYIYGSSKAGVDGFTQGLGDALHGSGARVLIVRPGFVATKMTAGMKAPPFSTTSAAVAEATERAMRHGRDIVWVPGVMRWVMLVVRHLPRPVFRRLPM